MRLGRAVRQGRVLRADSAECELGTNQRPLRVWHRGGTGRGWEDLKGGSCCPAWSLWEPWTRPGQGEGRPLTLASSPTSWPLGSQMGYSLPPRGDSSGARDQGLQSPLETTDILFSEAPGGQA